MTGGRIQVTPGDVQERRETAAASGWSYRPRLDITEDANEFTILADMPGTTAEGVQISFENRALSIRGAVSPRQRGEVEYLAHEFGIGDFDRELLLSDAIDAEKIFAGYERGVLTIHLPKSEKAKPRRIPVKGV
jgi:HSP20 family protein